MQNGSKLEEPGQSWAPQLVQPPPDRAPSGTGSCLATALRICVLAWVCPFAWGGVWLGCRAYLVWCRLAGRRRWRG